MYTIVSSVWIFKNQACISSKENKTDIWISKNKNLSPMYIFYRKSFYECTQFNLGGIGGFSLPCWEIKNFKAIVLHTEKLLGCKRKATFFIYIRK